MSGRRHEERCGLLLDSARLGVVVDTIRRYLGIGTFAAKPLSYSWGDDPPGPPRLGAPAPISPGGGATPGTPRHGGCPPPMTPGPGVVSQPMSESLKSPLSPVIDDL